MAIDVVVYPQYSPRLVEILTVTEASIQEIVDALRAWEDSEEGLTHPKLIDAAGKEDLGGGVQVGITATLQNTQIFFAPRTTPLDDGSGRTCDATDATGMNLYVDDADFVSAGVYHGATVQNVTTGELATVIEVVDANNLLMYPLSGYGGQGWTQGDEYAIYDDLLCTISGGNLVAIDDIGDPMSAVFPSPGVYLQVSAASSATLVGGGASAADIADAVWDEQESGHVAAGSFGAAVSFAKDVGGGRWVVDDDNNQLVLYKSDNSTEIARFNLKDADGAAASEDVYERVRV